MQAITTGRATRPIWPTAAMDSRIPRRATPACSTRRAQKRSPAS